MSRLCRPSLIVAGLTTALFVRIESLQAQEARWLFASRSPGLAFFVDQERVDTVGPNRYRMWIRRDYAVHRTMGRTSYNRVVSHALIDCEQNRLMDLERTYYLSDRPQFGAPVPADAQGWVEAPSDSLPAELLSRGCLVAEGRPLPAIK